MIARTFFWRLSLAAILPLRLLAAQGTPVTLDHESKHHLVFANEWVRVLDVVVPAGDSTLYHVHSNDYAYVTFGGVSLEAQPFGSPATDLVLSNGEVRFTRAPIAHRVVNPSGNPFHNLTIELLKSSGANLSPVTGGPVVLENDRIRAERIVLEPGQSSVRHEHRGPWLDVGVSDGKVVVVSSNGDTRTVLYRPGAYRWNDGPGSHTVKNVGPARVEIVEIEMK